MTINILAIGDVVGPTGLAFLKEHLKPLQKLKGVFLYGNVFKPVVNMVTAAPGIAINTAVGAASVYIHAIF